MDRINANAQHPDSRTGGQHVHTNKRLQVSPQGGKNQLSSFILFASLIIMINLCPFQSDQDAITSDNNSVSSSGKLWQHHADHRQNDAATLMSYLQSSADFVRLMFSQPMRLNRRVTRFSQAEARVLGKMAKVWYIKKKVKKLGKKLKKHTIAVPVFTAIPIYEHSYYPQPHVTHISHGGHHAAASSYVPTAVSHVTAASNGMPITAASTSPQQQMATSASNQHQMTAAYRLPPHRAYGGGAMYQPTAPAHQIINTYAPSPPLFVDDTGGLYGTYGNAYGRYDGGYHVW